MQKIYRIKLSGEERVELIELTTSGKRVSAKKVIKARTLLSVDESEAGPASTDKEIMDATGMTRLRYQATFLNFHCTPSIPAGPMRR